MRKCKQCAGVSKKAKRHAKNGGEHGACEKPCTISYENTQHRHPNPYQPNTTVAALVVVVVAPLVFGFVICPDVPFPFPVFDPPVVPVPPPPVRLPGDPKDAVGILEIVDHVPPERGGGGGLVKMR